MYQLITLLQAVFSVVFVLFVPGFCLSWAFYPRKEDLDAIERIVLSFGLGIASIALSIFYLNKLIGVPVNAGTSFLVVLLISAVASAAWYMRNNTYKPGKK